MKIQDEERPLLSLVHGRLCTVQFSCSFYNRDGQFQFRRLGKVCAAKPSMDDRLTLESCRFQPGDHLCVVIRDRDY